MTQVIEVKDLVRTYRSSGSIFARRKRKETVAVDGISFSVAQGELFGLLGPNGAGKTTTIKVLTTLLLPTSGEIRILGFDVAKQSMEVRKRIGLVLGGERGLYYRITGRQNLRYFADLYGVPIGDPGQEDPGGPGDGRPGGPRRREGGGLLPRHEAEAASGEGDRARPRSFSWTSRRSASTLRRRATPGR